MPSLTGSDLVYALLGDAGTSIPLTTVDLYVEMAVEELGSPCNWPSTGVYAQAYANLASHYLIVDQIRGADGALGPITGERAGEVSRQYGFNPNGVREDGLNTTGPGRRFLALLARNPLVKFSSTSRVYQKNRGKGACD